jgi:hypothetical protein
MNLLIAIGAIMAGSFVVGLIGIYWSRAVKRRKTELLQQFAKNNNYIYDQVPLESVNLVNGLFRILRTNTKKTDRLKGVLPFSKAAFSAQDAPVSVLMGVDQWVSELYLSFARINISIPLPAKDFEFVLLSRQNTRRLAGQQMRIVKKDQRVKLSPKFDRNFKLYASVGGKSQVQQVFTKELQELLLKRLSNCDIVCAGGRLEINTYNRLYPEYVEPVLGGADELVNIIRPILSDLAPITGEYVEMTTYREFYKFMFREGWPRFAGTFLYYPIYILVGWVTLVADNPGPKHTAQIVFLLASIVPVFNIVRYLYYRYGLRSLVK